MSREQHDLLWLGAVIIASVGLGVAFLLYLLFSYHHHHAYELVPLTQQEYNAVAAEGAPLVMAIGEYTSRVGLAPLSLDDLGKGTPATGHWDYLWTPWSWTLSQKVEGGTTVEYSNDDRWSGWGVNAYSLEVPEITFEQPWPEPVDLTVQERHANIRREFERRVREFSEDTVHSKGFFTWRFHHGSRDNARKIVLDLQETGLEPWWCARALAFLDLVTGDATGAVPALIKMAEQDPGFISWFMVATVFINTDRREEAADALLKATKYPLLEQREVEDDYVLSGFAWPAAGWAYRRRHYDLVLAVCDRWQALEESQGSAEQSYHALRAAALLALGKPEKARAPIERAIVANRKQAMWAGDLPVLLKAIERGDTTYTWAGTYELHRIDVFLAYR